MGGRELESDGLGSCVIDPDLHRRLAVHCADHVAAKNPHELDDLMPKLAGRQIAQDPAVRADVHELLDAIGYTSKEQQ
jgi:hypothetical protein